MKYKLVVLDMDGTLLNSNNEISDKNHKVLKETVERGINVAIATGRIFTSARGYAQLLGIETPIIACNGALIRNHITNEVIYTNQLNQKDALSIIEVCKKHGVYFHFYDQEKLYVEKQHINYLKEHYWGDRKRISEDITFELVEDANEYLLNSDIELLKFVLVDDEPQKLINIKEELKQIPTIEVDKSWHNNLEIMNKGVSKGQAISQLKDMLGIKKEEIISFGDNYNDLSMKDYSGAFVAMGNSEEEIKQVATFVTSSNNEDGVAEGIVKYVFYRL